jgi:hypothetical protein
MNRKASMTVEAALVFPLFILIWIPFLYCLKYEILYENLKQNVFNTAQILSSAGYLMEQTGLRDVQNGVYQMENEAEPSEMTSAASDWLEQAGEAGSYTADLLRYCLKILEAPGTTGQVIGREAWKGAVDEAWKLAASAVSGKMQPESFWIDLGAESSPRFAYSRFFYSKSGITDLISVIAYVPVRWPDPFGFFRDQRVYASVQTRAFVGNAWSSVSNTDNTADDEKKPTYYRIENGTHYHSLDCFLIEKDVVNMSREEALAEGYKPCKACGGGSGIVYITKGGIRYHMKGCRYLFPDLTELTEEEIESGRYKPCGFCQLGGDWFS